MLVPCWPSQSMGAVPSPVLGLSRDPVGRCGLLWVYYNGCCIQRLLGAFLRSGPSCRAYPTCVTEKRGDLRYVLTLHPMAPACTSDGTSVFSGTVCHCGMNVAQLGMQKGSTGSSRVEDISPTPRVIAGQGRAVTKVTSKVPEKAGHWPYGGVVMWWSCHRPSENLHVDSPYGGTWGHESAAFIPLAPPCDGKGLGEEWGPRCFPRMERLLY